MQSDNKQEVTEGERKTLVRWGKDNKITDFRGKKKTISINVAFNFL